MSKLPKVLYVKREKERDGTSYFVTDADLFSLASAEGAVVGVYHLVKKKRVKLVAQAKDMEGG